MKFRCQPASLVSGRRRGNPPPNPVYSKSLLHMHAASAVIGSMNSRSYHDDHLQVIAGWTTPVLHIPQLFVAAALVCSLSRVREADVPESLIARRFHGSVIRRFLPEALRKLWYGSGRWERGRWSRRRRSLVHLAPCSSVRSLRCGICIRQ